jgi:hypothetical protein
MAAIRYVGSTDGAPPIIRKYATASGVAAGDIVLLSAGALALATDTNGAASVLGLLLGSDVPAATDIIPKAGLDQQATGVNRMGAQGSTTGFMSVMIIRPQDILEIDHTAGAQFANTVIGSTTGIKGATTSSKSYNDTSYTALANIVKVVTMPTSTVDGRVQVRFFDDTLDG